MFENVPRPRGGALALVLAPQFEDIGRKPHSQIRACWLTISSMKWGAIVALVADLILVSCTGAGPRQVVSERPVVKPGLYGRIPRDDLLGHGATTHSYKPGDPANLSRPLLYGYVVSQRIPLVWYIQVARPRSGR